MWQMTSPWYEPVIRSFVVYFFIFLVVRIIGKKKLGEFAPFEVILLLIMGVSVQNAVIGNDHSITAGIICVAVLGGLNILINNLAYRFRWFEKIIEGQPEVIILNGKIHRKILEKEKITDAELYEALREHEIMNAEDVKCAILEADGKISVIKYAH